MEAKKFGFCLLRPCQVIVDFEQGRIGINKSINHLSFQGDPLFLEDWTLGSWRSALLLWWHARRGQLS